MDLRQSSSQDPAADPAAGSEGQDDPADHDDRSESGDADPEHVG